MTEDDTFKALLRCSFETVYIAAYWASMMEERAVVLQHNWTWTDFQKVLQATHQKELEAIIDRDYAKDYRK